ncbi:hypothetical protein BDV29DRAFT_155060 [Aspergillus leporis]|jgi:quercetin dioxygenase-like cupin family protein|uniref:Cupin type-2 domain-containing protein n=1 Tax=Aspergillus leporis TaxID=41062 RepID=A0A5N5X9D9_9EURO|nr:hypothetical protein BDV29DRAFT_155060 [Aspergillus leporis]
MVHNPMPSPKVVITNHTPDGTSIIARQAPAVAVAINGTSFSGFHVSNQVPVNAIEPLPPSDVGPAAPRAPPEGLMFGSIDFPPGFSVPLHRTMSVDYGTIVSGEITLLMDSGEEAVLRAGDVYVQRGTSHGWVNKGPATCRMTFVAVSREQMPFGPSGEMI